MQSFLGWRRSPRRRSADRIEPFSTRIGVGVLFEGALHGPGNYLVEGEVVGGGDVEGAIVLAAGAYWKGNLAADHVRISGKVEGDISGRSKIELAPTAVVIGNLSSPVIAIAEGAQYEGTISRPRQTQVTRFTERRAENSTRLPA